MNVRALIVDDEPLARQVLKEFSAGHPALEIIGECENGKQAVVMSNRLQPDLLFLDVQMPGLSGFEVLEKLDRVPAVIFSTAYDQFAIRAFEVHAVDYLLKPYDRERFATAVDRAIERLQKSTFDIDQLAALINSNKSQQNFPDRLLVKSGSRLVPIRMIDIEWIEAADDYSELHAGGATHLCSLGLGQLERRLDRQKFARVHRSAIINLSRVRNLEKDGEGGMIATMASGKEIKVSRSYATELRKLIV
jgi:two-component system LytT family response regulator